MLAQLESSLGMELQRRQPLLVQPGDGGLGEFLLAEVGQRRAAPQSQRLDEQRRPGLGVLSLVRERHQVPEPLRVDRVVAGPKEIARWLVHHQVSAARLGLFQRPPQLRDLGLQRVDRIARRPPAPQGFGQPVVRHWPPLLDQQTGQQIGQQRTDLQVRDLDRLPVRPPHRQRTEHSETHSSHRTRGARRSTVRRPSADRARLSADWTADVVTNDRVMCLVHANAILGLRAGRREWIGLAVLTLPCLLYAMDLTVLNLAVPHLSADLRPSSVQLLWIVDVYGFLVAGLLITMGTLGDRIGRRRLLLAGAAAFGVASLLAALSTSAGMLIAARALLVVGLAVGVVLVRRQHTLADPLLDLRLFRVTAFSAALTTNVLSFFVGFGALLFIAQYLQLVLGLSPLAAGLWMLPASAGFIVGSMLTPVLAGRVRPGSVMAGGLGLAAVGFGLLTQLGSDHAAGLAVLVAGSVVFSLALAPVDTLATDLAVGSAPPERAGAASALAETSAEFGGALGIAILGVVGTAAYRGQMAHALPAGVPPQAAAAARDTLGGAVAAAGQLPDQLGQALLGAARQAFTLGLQLAFAVSAAAAVAVAVLAAVLLVHRVVGSSA